METTATEQLVGALRSLAEEAGRTVLSHYQTGIRVDFKGPRDPVTQADRAANELICERLERLFPGVPVVAEESAPERYAGYAAAGRAFFVDPLDGTQEFIAGNGEFVVMIGLVEAGRAIAGVIASPTQGRVWAGALSWGAFEWHGTGEPSALRPSGTRELSSALLVASRSHRSLANQAQLDSLAARRVENLGSAGLKGAAVATGQADIYLAPQRAGSRWDACAVDALVTAAGGRFSDARGQALDYGSDDLQNHHGLLASNGWLHDAVLQRVAAHNA